MPGPQAESKEPGDWAAGTLRRGAAFAIDALILVAAGTALGSALFNVFMALGQWGKALGLATALSYFGLGDSARYGGATPGKRLMGIRVKGRDGEPVTPVRAGARALVFLVPWLLEPRCSACPATVEAALGILVYGGGAAILYLLIFNRGTGQSLHDLLTGAFVTRAGDAPPLETHPWKGHYVLAASCALVVAFFISLAEYDRTWHRYIRSSAQRSDPGPELHGGFSSLR
jgi:uncharacterized RDD family membrane protein YckC